MRLSAVREVLERDAVPLVRTWFHDEPTWNEVRRVVLAPGRLDDSRLPQVVPIDDRGFDGVSPDTLRAAMGRWPGRRVLVADELSELNAPDLTVIYLDLAPVSDTYRFRCEAALITQVKSDLATGNAQFVDFAIDLAYDGVFRGFQPPDRPG